MTTTTRIDAIHDRIASFRAALLEHRVYQEIDSLAKLRIFMQHHVFAVWDFMSLLKALQRGICGTEVPWLPSEDATSSRLINEIVLGEECDENGAGGYASHFNLYHQAMQQCGADTGTIDRLIRELRQEGNVETALSRSAPPASVREFLLDTFGLIDRGNLCAIASAFTFGREDLLPDVFQQIVDQLNVEACGGLDRFLFYLHRHIELDGDRHGPMAAQLIAALCADDDANWQAAENAAAAALESRLKLWDGMVEAMHSTAAST